MANSKMCFSSSTLAGEHTVTYAISIQKVSYKSLLTQWI